MDCVQRKFFHYQGWIMLAFVLIISSILSLCFSECFKFLIDIQLISGIVFCALGLICFQTSLPMRRMFAHSSISFEKIIQAVAKEFNYTEEDITLGLLNAIYLDDLNLEKDIKILQPSTNSNCFSFSESRQILYYENPSNSESEGMKKGPLAELTSQPVTERDFIEYLNLYTSLLKDLFGEEATKKIRAKGQLRSLKENKGAFDHLLSRSLDCYKSAPKDYENPDIFIQEIKKFTMSGPIFRKWLQNFLDGKYTCEIIKKA